MTSADLLVDAFERVRDAVHRAVDGLNPQELQYRVDPDANSIGWLVWHLSRVQDDHLAELIGGEQVWTAKGWMERFGLPFAPEATGYGHGGDDVGAVRVKSGDVLTGYYDAVHEQTIRYVKTLTDADLPRVVDTAWEPPVTLAVRLISVVNDNTEHAGQAAFVRGVVTRVGTD
ncbi:mycothiol transferase [Fodinicola feengrottensis]|uniref:DUF664 domain-containing protein n=1 Tax=Fodinicola feengrottensis TaxID=435914 RepID=A0ABP4SJB2_9ACTN|nr:DUF664 domain-containing protein [Fodinicola feengrottensis]